VSALIKTQHWRRRNIKMVITEDLTPGDTTRSNSISSRAIIGDVGDSHPQTVQ
jgi:hypothetical protein